MTPSEALSPGFFGPRHPAFESRSFSALSSKLRTPRLDASWVRETLGPAASSLDAATKALREATPAQRLLLRATMGWTSGEQAALATLGYDGYLERQLDYESIDAGPLEDALHDALPTLSMTPFELITTYGEDDPGVPAFELILATLFRSIYSPRQLYERMVVFWSDHFNIDLFSDFANFLKPVDDREVVRPHALGKFPDLLRASAHSPAMLIYLTNASNVKDHPNENYARELMELHTLGADRGYTQEDVVEVARAFTGWTVKGPDFGPELGRFLFAPQVHDNRSKRVLGQRLPPGGGIADGETVIDILAAHPNTADFVSRKMLRYLWGYDPPQSRVDRVARTYLDTGGDIRAMLRVILKRAWMASATPKLKRPYHFLTSAVRALGAQVTDAGYLIEWLYGAGQLPFTWPPPNGFPDSEGFWSGFVLSRWNYSAEFLQTGVEVDVPALDPERNPSLTRAAVRGRLNRQLLGNRMSAPTKAAIRDYLAAVPLDRRSVADAIGLGVASPDFQYY